MAGEGTWSKVPLKAWDPKNLGCLKVKGGEMVWKRHGRHQPHHLACDKVVHKRKEERPLAEAAGGAVSGGEWTEGNGNPQR